MSDDNSEKSKGFKFDYVTDTCFLGITVNSNNLLLPNHVGEGDGTVYIHGFDDGDPIDIPSGRDQTHLLVVVGKNAGEHTPMALGLRHSNTDLMPEVIIVAEQFHIYEVKDSRDFVIKVSAPKCVKSLVASGQGHLKFKGFDKQGD